MSKFTFEFDITNLLHVKTEKRDSSGNMVKCLIIPLEKNFAELNFKGDGFIIRGTMVPVSNPVAGGRTHTMRLSVPKGVYSAMTEEQKNKIPWLGSAKEWPDTNQTQKPETNAAQPSQRSQPDFGEDPDNDLPF